MNLKTLLLMIVPLLTIRVAWNEWPSLWLSAIFWISVLAMIGAWAHLLRKRSIPPHCAIVAAIGASLNAIVVIANGGVMPVFGKSADFETGIWRSAENGGNLLFLADRMALAGASPGDMFIAAGLILGLSVAFVRGARSVSRRLRMALA